MHRNIQSGAIGGVSCLGGLSTPSEFDLRASMWYMGADLLHEGAPAPMMRTTMFLEGRQSALLNRGTSGQERGCQRFGKVKTATIARGPLVIQPRGVGGGGVDDRAGSSRAHRSQAKMGATARDLRSIKRKGLAS